MDLAFSPEQEELVRTLRGFARKELQPHSARWDKSAEFPWDAWRQMGELGLLGLRMPAAYGGQEADYLTFGIAMEEIARGDFACTYGLQLAGLAGEILGRSGSEEVKARWLPPTARGEVAIALALTEPGVGSDAANLVCRAERDGDGYLMTGEKSGISLGMVAQAAIVFARTDPAGRARGVTAFLVPLDLPGVSRSPLRDMGTRAISRAVLAFDHVRLPASHRLGEEGTGFHQVMQGFDYNRVGIALACLGVAQVSLEETMAYVKERKAFGRALATFEGVSFALAEDQVVGATPRGRDDPPVPALPRPLRVHGRAALRAADARRHRARDRRRRGGGHENDRGPRDDGTRKPAILACRRRGHPAGRQHSPGLDSRRSVNGMGAWNRGWTLGLTMALAGAIWLAAAPSTARGLEPPPPGPPPELPGTAAPPPVVGQLQAALASAVQQFERQDTVGVLSHVSDRYRTGPVTKATLREEIPAMFALYDTLTARVRIDAVRMVGDHAWVYSSGEVAGRLRWLGRWVPVLTWQRELEVARREDGVWRLFGYQQ